MYVLPFVNLGIYLVYAVRVVYNSYVISSYLLGYIFSFLL